MYKLFNVYTYLFMYIIHVPTHIILYNLLNGNANSTELLSMASFYTEYVHIALYYHT